MKAHRLVTVLLVLILSVGLVLLDRGDVEDARDSVLAHPSTSELRQQWLDQRYGELGDVERAQSVLAVIERRTGRGPKTKQVRLSGTWTERGSSNVAGRVVDVGFNAATGRLYLLSAGGTLWSASWSRLDWTPINDSMRVYGARQVLVGNGDTPTVVATGTDSPRNVLSVRESSRRIQL